MTMDGKDQTPEGRSTTFQAVQGEPEHYSGTTLLVSAYAAIWTILLVWVALAWRRQSALSARLDDLERVIDGASAAPPRGGPHQGGAVARARSAANEPSEEKQQGG
jgi:CcmD family protein